MEIELLSGHKILQLTEAGIIGKIGLNNRGLGQTLNILWVVDQVLLGVPIHIVLRALLESGTLEEALEAIARSGHGKASNIIIAGAGRAFDIEFDGGASHCHEIRERVYAHTNHYLHIEKLGQWDDPERENSITRHQTALSKLKQIERHSPERLAAILSDQSQGENSILSPYQVDTQIDLGYCGTVATLVMDLNNGILKVRRGNPLSPNFDEDAFIRYSIK
jgi:isopenicillin-N N-acyltransferase-like protein